MTSKRVRIVYWVSTLLFVLPLTWSAILYLVEAPKMVETMTHLGYPIYFMKVLGTAKLLGVAAILYGRFPRLKEWAFAGFTFDLIGAFLSHLSSGDPLYVAVIPLGFLGVLMVSYLSWKRFEGEESKQASLQ
ncbi:MAG: DoxX family protein [Acidobacteriota bacterium]